MKRAEHPSGAARRSLVAIFSALVLVVAPLVAPAASAAPPTSGAYYGRIMVGSAPAGAGEVRVTYFEVNSPFSTGSVLTDADGYWVIPTAAPTWHRFYLEYLGDPSHGILDTWVMSNAYGGSLTQAPTFHASNTPSVGYLWTMLPALTISGTVTLEGQTLAAGDVRVSMRRSTSAVAPWEATQVVGADGTFAFAGVVPAPNVQLRVQYVGSGNFDTETFAALSNMLRVAPVSTADITVLAQIPLSGRIVLSPATVPAAGTVTVVESNSAGAPLAGMRAVTADETGAFTVWTDPGGSNSRTIRATYSGTGYFAPTWWGPVTRGASNVFAIPAAFPVSGVVTRNGIPAPTGSVQVSATLTNGSIRTTLTGAGGEWSIPDLRAGSYQFSFSEPGNVWSPRVVVGSSGFAAASSSATGYLAVDAPMSAGTVELAPGASISGVVRDTTGNPVAGETVSASRSSSPNGGWFPRRETVTDAEGRYRFTGLEFGSPSFPVYYRIHVGGGSSSYSFVAWPAANERQTPTAILMSSVTSSATADLVVPRAAGITGVVSGVSRSLAPWAELLVWTPTTSSWVRWGSSQSVTGPGFTFPGLTAGEYRIRVWVARRSVTSPTLTAAPGETVEWDVNLAPSIGRDYSGDGRGDVLAVSNGTYSVYTVGAGGSLQSPTRIAVPWGAGSTVVPVGDVTSDGFADVVVRDRAGVAWLYARRADGGWRPAVKIGTGWGAYDRIIGAGDLNGDTFPDLVLRSRSVTRLMFGNGAGGFPTSQVDAVSLSGFPTLVAAGDWDRDGSNDLIGRTSGGTLVLISGSGFGSFGDGGWKVIATRWSGYTGLAAVGDITGDGVGDFVARGSNGTLYLFPGLPEGGWGDRQRLASGWASLTPVA